VEKEKKKGKKKTTKHPKQKTKTRPEPGSAAVGNGTCRPRAERGEPALPWLEVVGSEEAGDPCGVLRKPAGVSRSDSKEKTQNK
jgi:hypothetical protein